MHAAMRHSRCLNALQVARVDSKVTRIERKLESTAAPLGGIPYH